MPIKNTHRLSWFGLVAILIAGTSSGALSDITDVTDVQVGHFTLKQGPRFNTGITAVLPHGGNLFHEKVPDEIVVGNGFGKLLGSTQVNEPGKSKRRSS